MAGTPTKFGSRLAMIMVIIPMVAVAYFISPLFLPRWRWENMSNWEELAQKLGKPKEQLQKTYVVVMRHAPRGEGDPTPWQVISSEPLYDPENDEPKHKVRVSLINDRNGEPMSRLRLGSGNYRDQFFKGTVWRFPPGAFGMNKFHPVLVYKASDFDKVESMEAYRWSGEMSDGQNWTNDDDEIEDGFKKPGAAGE